MYLVLVHSYKLWRFKELTSTILSYFLTLLCLFGVYEAFGRQIEGLIPPNTQNQNPQLNFSHSQGQLEPEPKPEPEFPIIDSVVFDTNLTDPKLLRIFIQCDLVQYGDFVELLNGARKTLEVKELNLKIDTVQNPWMSCRFFRWLKTENKKWSGELSTTPPETPTMPFDPYYNVSLSGSRGNGSVTHINLNDTGIFAEQRLLSHWSVTDVTGISLDPGYKRMRSRPKDFSMPCMSICAQRILGMSPLCVYENNGKYKVYCDPNEDFDIRKYAYHGILTTKGTPCISKCEWGSSRMGGEGFACQVRRYYVLEEASKEPCSPSTGFTYQGVKCTGRCTFQNNNFMTCPTLNVTWSKMCSA